MGKCYLILENGRVFEGVRFGAEKDVVAEIAFTTGVGGYLETLSDKSFHGQAVVQTFPVIGNYGVIPSDFESEGVQVAAYIVREVCDAPSNFRSEGTVRELLEKSGVPGVMGVDTRAVTRIIREQGAMNVMICSELPKDMDAALEKIKSYKVKGAVAAVSCGEKYDAKPEKRARFHVAMIDYGLKQNILRELLKRGCRVTVFPQSATAKEVLAAKPDGIMLSNGPGDPKDNPEAIKTLAEIAKSGVPVFAICLGHQLFALANGFSSEKLKYGHRGENQPVRCEKNGRVYVTSQNHGYAIIKTDKSAAVSSYWTNENDGTVEGMYYKDIPALTVQFHPEACGGPHDTEFLFDEFIAMMNEKKSK